MATHGRKADLGPGGFLSRELLINHHGQQLFENSKERLLGQRTLTLAPRAALNAQRFRASIAKGKVTVGQGVEVRWVEGGGKGELLGAPKGMWDG